MENKHGYKRRDNEGIKKSEKTQNKRGNKMIRIKLTQKDRVLLMFAILFGLVFGIMGNMFSTMVFRVIDHFGGGLPPLIELGLYVLYVIAVFGFMGFLFLQLGKYTIIVPEKTSKKKK